LGLFVKPIPEIVKKSLEQAEKPKQILIQPRSKSTEDEERARLSKTINDELLKKVNFQQDFLEEKDAKKKINFDIDTESDKKLSPSIHLKENLIPIRSTMKTMILFLFCLMVNKKVTNSKR